MPLEFGSMRVTLIKGKHWPYPDKELDALLLNSEIEEPIIPPISAMAYKEGPVIPSSLHIRKLP